MSFPSTPRVNSAMLGNHLKGHVRLVGRVESVRLDILNGSIPRDMEMEMVAKGSALDLKSLEIRMHHSSTRPLCLELHSTLVDIISSDIALEGPDTCFKSRRNSRSSECMRLFFEFFLVANTTIWLTLPSFLPPWNH